MLWGLGLFQLLLNQPSPCNKGNYELGIATLCLKIKPKISAGYKEH